MSEKFVGQIILVGFTFAPIGWALCDGSVLSIANNEVLFALLGTTFGGDGAQTFALPDLRGRAVVGSGQGPGLGSYVQGQKAGSEAVTLTSNQFWGHAHQLTAAASVTSADPGASVVLGTPPITTKLYASTGTGTQLAPGAISSSPGGNQPHENRSPFLALNYIIALEGIFPSPS
ncbi:MAG TPA: tail fiber protein [Aliidongia sp.]|nr:tail fiber protein [Aliidongia sp.]